MRRVVKLGGSLLIHPNLTQDMDHWLGSQPRAEHWILVGGGQLIDAVRDWDRIHPTNGERIHWRCVELLRFTFRQVADWFPQWHAVETAEQLRSAMARPPQGEAPLLVCVSAFYCPHQHFDLPQDWRTTTDSIAAALAVHIHADELVLLKSCPIDDRLTLDELASQGIIDAAFPLHANQLPNIRIERLATKQRSRNQL